MVDNNLNNTSGNINQLVECPRCGNQFELSETFRAHFEEEKRREVENAVQESEKRIRADVEQDSEAELAERDKQVKKLEKQLETIEEAQKVRESNIRAELAQDNQEKLEESAKEIKTLQEELQANEKARGKREAEIREEAEKKVSSEFAVQRAEWDVEKQRLEGQMADMQRQLGQKSVELQGEALEVYLKQKLQTEFPFDTIEDIGRGQRGADLTQKVNDARLGACGILVWEAKRTKHWNDSWIEKIKEDADRVGAHVRVIVSEALPADIEVFALKDGVWVCSIEAAIPLALALRTQLIESTRLQRAAQGKNVKMDEIYQYLTSPRFAERIERMVETWDALEKQIMSEERSMRRQWKERRKQLAKMQDTTLEMFTEFSAILGQEMAQIPGLELESLPPGDNVEVIDSQ